MVVDPVAVGGTPLEGLWRRQPPALKGSKDGPGQEVGSANAAWARRQFSVLYRPMPAPLEADAGEGEAIGDGTGAGGLGMNGRGRRAFDEDGTGPIVEGEDEFGSGFVRAVVGSVGGGVGSSLVAGSATVGSSTGSKAGGRAGPVVVMHDITE